MNKILLSLFIVFLVSIFVNNINGELNSGSSYSGSPSGSSSFSESSASYSGSLSGSSSSVNSENSDHAQSSGSSSSSSTSRNIILPNDENIYYSGRFDKTQSNDFYGFSWSGCQIAVVVTGTTSINIILDSAGDNWFDIFINNAVYPPFNVSMNPDQEYNILGDAQLDPSQTYTVLVVKRTEAEFGLVRFYGFSIDPHGTFLSSYSPPSRRIEFIGDSITCGYGDLGTAPCNFEPNTEDNYVTYASITSRELDCEMYLEAWSGRGVVRNYGSPTPTSSSGTVPDIYPYTIPTDTTTEWDFSNFIPDAVVINLGTNDYSTQPAPSQDQFQSGYIEFIKTIRSNYNDLPQIFLICGPMISSPCCDYVANISTIVGATYIDAQGILNEPADIGCNGHPSVLGHTKLAAVVSPIIQKTMGWN